MKALFQTSQELANLSKALPVRNVLTRVNWDAQLNVILGLRGVGKTTQLLHQLNKKIENGKQALYISLDDFYFLDNKLWDVIENYHQAGGEYLFIDEVHYDARWDRAIKLAFDRYPRLKMTVTGSSALKVYQSKADLSRRGHFYHMPGLSFIEYLSLKHNIIIPGPYPLDELISNAIEISSNTMDIPGILSHFKEYIKQGYFPFSLNDNIDINRQLKQLVENIVDVDLGIIHGLGILERRQVLKFLRYLVSRSPYELNVSKVASIIGIDRNKVISYLYSLEQADLLYFINDPNNKKGNMSKPDKVYLSNPNLYYALNHREFNLGCMREAFVLNQLIMSQHEIALHSSGDFLVDENIVFEIGGRNKSTKQIANLSNAYILADDIEIAFGRYIPMWMMGLLY